MRRYIPGAACWGSTAPKLPVHRRSPARCTSRRWRLLACPYWAGRGRPAGRPSESARLPQAVPPPACGWWVSALFERVGKENGAPRSSPDAPASVPSCWLITAFPACVILPQMNHQPMCIWMVKPPFTQYISLIYGGILTKRCIWSLYASASMISTPFCSHCFLKISPMSFLICPYISFLLYFGANTI